MKSVAIPDFTAIVVCHPFLHEAHALPHSWIERPAYGAFPDMEHFTLFARGKQEKFPIIGKNGQFKHLILSSTFQDVRMFVLGHKKSPKPWRNQPRSIDLRKRPVRQLIGHLENLAGVYQFGLFTPIQAYFSIR
jgi:hypothetical protein